MRPGLIVLMALTLMLSPAYAPLAGPGSAEAVPGTDDHAASAPSGAPIFGDNANVSIVIYFFYGSGCPHCALIEPYVDSVAAKYPQVTLMKLEVYYNSTNRALYQEFNERFNIRDPVVPSVLIEDTPLVGEGPIEANLEPIILRAIEAGSDDDGDIEGPDANGTDDGSCDANNTCGTNDTVDPPLPEDTSPGSGDGGSSTDLTVTMIIVAAAADSINPCAISVMIFLLLFLTSLGDRRKVLLIGVVYITTVYAVYFVAGLGLLAFLHSTAMTRTIYYAAAVVSIAIGLINIKDFFFFGKKATLAIPESKKPVIKRYVEMASIPAAVALGFLVSLFELPCTGGIYFAILSLLGDSMTASQGIPYLALYNAIYVLPLAVILGIILLGVSAERANSWRLENRRSLRLIVGVVMLLLGIMMLLGFL